MHIHSTQTFVDNRLTTVRQALQRFRGRFGSLINITYNCATGEILSQSDITRELTAFLLKGSRVEDNKMIRLKSKFN